MRRTCGSQQPDLAGALDHGQDEGVDDAEDRDEDREAEQQHHHRKQLVDVALERLLELRLALNSDRGVAAQGVLEVALDHRQVGAGLGLGVQHRVTDRQAGVGERGRARDEALDTGRAVIDAAEAELVSLAGRQDDVDLAAQ
jgi:hypothetical protein